MIRLWYEEISIQNRLTRAHLVPNVKTSSDYRTTKGSRAHFKLLCCNSPKLFLCCKLNSQRFRRALETFLCSVVKLFSGTLSFYFFYQTLTIFLLQHQNPSGTWFQMYKVAYSRCQKLLFCSICKTFRDNPKSFYSDKVKFVTDLSLNYETWHSLSGPYRAASIETLHAGIWGLKYDKI